mgnify:CR=1 FL=1
MDETEKMDLERWVKELVIGEVSAAVKADAGWTMPPAIAKAIAIAQGLMQRVGHDGKNLHHWYRYTSAEAVIEASIEPMAKAGLGLVQCGWEPLPPRCDTWFDVSDKGEQLEQRVSGPARIEIRYMLVHESGVAWWMPPVTMPVLPEKGRPMDKAEATALTYSLGYVLRGLLKIPRTDDADDLDQRDDRGRDDRPARQQQQQTRARQPERTPEPAPTTPANLAVNMAEVEKLIDAAETEKDLKVAWGRVLLLKRSVSREDFEQHAEGFERLSAKKDAAKERFSLMDAAERGEVAPPDGE